MQFEPQTQPGFSWPHSRFLQEGRKLERDYCLSSATVLACFKRKIGKRAEGQLDNKVDSGGEGTYACVSIARLCLKPDVSAGFEAIRGGKFGRRRALQRLHAAVSRKCNTHFAIL
jgi:hypothetical protein